MPGLKNPVCCICADDREVIFLKDFGASVCRKCIPAFVSGRTLSTIRSYHMLKPGQRVAVAVSGGKDSSAMLHVLSALTKRLQIEVVPFHLHLGFGRFSDRILETAVKNSKKSGFEIEVYFIKDFGVRIEPVGSFPACAVCGALKRTIFNRIARELGCQVLATAHTFDDMFLFAIKNLVSRKDNIPSPVLKSAHPSVPLKIKPFCRIPEYLIEEYCRATGLEYEKQECPVSDGRGHALKKVFEQIDAVSPGMRRQILDNLKRIFKACGKKQKDLLFDCKICGEPSTQEVCPLCRVRSIQSKSLP